MIETGLGGRLDATNVLQPLLTITTGLSRDHMEILGDSYAKLAYEKGGIIKPRTPHLTVPQTKSAMKVFEKICLEKDAPLFCLGPRLYTLTENNTKLHYHGWGLNLSDITVGMPGLHQLHNAALAIRAMMVIKMFNRIRMPARAIRTGLRRAIWPGRFQIIKQKGQPTLVLDVCHNVGSVKAFVETFQALYPGKKTRILTGFVKRKEHQQMFNLLSRVAESYALVPLATKRSIDIDELIKTLNWRGIPLTRYGRLKTAFNKLLKTAEPNDIISIIGSHFLVGEFLEENGWP